MPLNRKKKQKIIDEIDKVAKNSISAVVANFRGVSANKMNELRRKSRENGVYLQVIRNTLLSRVVKGTTYECLKTVFINPSIVAFSKENPGAAARLFREFSKKNPIFEVKAAVFKGEYIPANKIDYLANLPTYKEAIIHFLLILKEVSVGKLFRTITAIHDKKKKCKFSSNI